MEKSCKIHLVLKISLISSFIEKYAQNFYYMAILKLPSIDPVFTYTSEIGKSSMFYGRPFLVSKNKNREFKIFVSLMGKRHRNPATVR